MNIVFSEVFDVKSNAMKREKELKSFRRSNCRFHPALNRGSSGFEDFKKDGWFYKEKDETTLKEMLDKY